MTKRVIQVHLDSALAKHINDIWRKFKNQAKLDYEGEKYTIERITKSPRYMHADVMLKLI